MALAAPSGEPSAALKPPDFHPSRARAHGETRFPKETWFLSPAARAGKSILLRIGRLSAKHAIERQSALFNLAATLALKVMPLPTQLKMGLENAQGGFRKIWESFGQTLSLRVEDRGETIAYIMETCTMCAGKQADGVICLAWTGALQESGRWLTGKEFGIEEVECRATGAQTCVWEIHKQPKE